MPPPAPPSPSLPPAATEPSPYIADPEAIRSGVTRDLDAVEAIWGLRSDPSSSSNPSVEFPRSTPSSSRSEFIDVLHILKVTTRAIRSVRNYLVALPDDHPTLHFGANLIEAFRNHSMGRPGTLGRRGGAPRHSAIHLSSSPAQPAPIIGPTPPDPPSVIRRSALDVLTVLRVLEERCRIPLSDEAYHADPDRLRAESPVSFALDHASRGRASPGADDASSDTGASGTLVASPPQNVPHSPKPDVVPLKIQGRDKTVHVWADPDEGMWDDFDDDPVEKEDPWDERLVLGGGWLYRRDIELSSLDKERNVIKKYLEVVDEVVFANSIPIAPGERGWQRARLDSTAVRSRSGRPSSRASDGSASNSANDAGLRKRVISTTLLDAMSEVSMHDEPSSIEARLLPPSPRSNNPSPISPSIPDESLAEWAQRASFEGDPIGRIHAMIAAHLPPELLGFLPSPSTSLDPSDPFATSSAPTERDQQAFREHLLTVLSDGQIICTTYNAIVRRSRNPWGYIQLENVHDLLGLTEEPEREHLDLDLSLGSSQRANAKSKSSWTFRRTENLRYWAAALKLRYMIPFVLPQPPQPAIQGLKRVTEQKSSSSLSRAFNDPVISPPVLFEPRVIAAKEEGWEDMFQRALVRWMDAVLEEKRTRAIL
ncbi:hypothetical protein DL93DRAFT_2073052 [Clavulina sp. PMI_390]|nr:hypothetical protein DL93DRAFT_2073052 [Clavulina sp. PMI_390]